LGLEAGTTDSRLSGGPVQPDLEAVHALGIVPFATTHNEVLTAKVTVISYKADSASPLNLATLR
jgi:hypothetical protein